MVYQTAYNATDGPLVADDFGRTIGGHEFGTVDTTCDSVESAVDQGRIHLFVGGLDAAPGQSPEAVEAQERTRTYQERAGVLHAAEKVDVVAFAKEAGLIEADAEPHKSEVIGILTPRVDIDIAGLAGLPVAVEAPAALEQATDAPSDADETSARKSRKKEQS